MIRHLGTRSRSQTTDGSADYHSAAVKAVHAARTVTDPFHVVHFAADKLAVCCRRIQQAATGRRARSGDPLYGVRRKATYRLNHGLSNAYGQPQRDGKVAMYKLLRSIRAGVPRELPVLAQPVGPR